MCVISMFVDVFVRKIFFVDLIVPKIIKYLRLWKIVKTDKLLNFFLSRFIPFLFKTS